MGMGQTVRFRGLHIFFFKRSVNHPVFGECGKLVNPIRDGLFGRRSISPNKTIYVLCWAFVGRMLGVCWAHVGAAFGLVGHMFSHDGPIFWVQVGPMAVLC
jgi:hypothetical protein